MWCMKKKERGKGEFCNFADIHRNQKKKTFRCHWKSILQRRVDIDDTSGAEWKVGNLWMQLFEKFELQSTNIQLQLVSAPIQLLWYHQEQDSIKIPYWAQKEKKKISWSEPVRQILL